MSRWTSRRPNGTFFATPRQRSSEDLRLRRVSVPSDFEGLIEKVVLVERMREVRALIGFTRIIAPEDFEDESRTKVGKRAPRRGETRLGRLLQTCARGIFVHFERCVAAVVWLRPDVGVRRQIPGRRTGDGAVCEASNRRRKATRLRYVLLHSFAHILMRQVALSAGIRLPASENGSTRAPNQFPERPEPMAGVLIHTAAPDSEGTLGDCCSGEPDDLARLIQSALRRPAMRLDPLCSEHPPSFDGITRTGPQSRLFVRPETS